MSSNSAAFRLRDTANDSAEFEAPDRAIGAPTSAEHSNRPSDANRFSLLLTAKPETQFDFLNERFLINTDLTSETSTPVDEFDVKHSFIYDAPSSERSSIDLKLATEHFEDYPSDSRPAADYLESELDEFEEANDDLINLYASAISGLSIGSVNSGNLPVACTIGAGTSITASNKVSYAAGNTAGNRAAANSTASHYAQLGQTDKIRLRKQVEDKVERFKQNSKNRFSQQIESSSALLRDQQPVAKDDLALVGAGRARPDEIGMILDESDDYSSEEDPVGSRGGSLKRSLDAFSKQVSRLDERPVAVRSEANYQEKLNELSDWSIDTIVSDSGRTWIPVRFLCVVLSFYDFVVIIV